MSDLTPQSETPTPTTDKITQAARETLYLCNFRVSVDGDWLCLRELNDISLTPDPEPAHEGNLLRVWWHPTTSSKALCLWNSDGEARVELCHGHCGRRRRFDVLERCCCL